MSAPSRGGVFVPHATAKEQSQLAWGHVASATAIGAVLTAGSSINTYPINEPLPLAPKAPGGGQK